MMPQNLDALFSAMSAPPGGGRVDAMSAAPDVSGWAEALALFDNLGQTGGALEMNPAASDWTASLAELAARTEQLAEKDGQLPEGLGTELMALFGLLDGADAPASEVADTRPYDGAYWPSSGEMMLLYQGISPWGDQPGEEQQQWLVQVGPYLGITELTSAYDGPMDVNRDFTLVNLADAAGADPQQAFVDGWLGRTKPDVARNAYEIRWQHGQSGAVADQVVGAGQLNGEQTLARLNELVQDLLAQSGETSLDGLARASDALGDDERRQVLLQLREALARGSSRTPAFAEGAVRALEAGRDSVGREPILSRLAEMQALFRETDPGASRGMPEINRIVLSSPQFANAGGGSPSADSGPPRTDVQLPPLATAARDPALPPTAQLLGQPGASAGDMRAAAEQAMERVVWMAARQQGVSQARLQLHPAHLGKVDIRLDVQGREASVVLNVQNAPVREAVEAMLPRLREQLEDQGLQLGDASVFDSGPEDSAAEERAEALLADSGNSEEDEQDGAVPVQPELNLRGRGLLDTYA